MASGGGDLGEEAGKGYTALYECCRIQEGDGRQSQGVCEERERTQRRRVPRLWPLKNRPTTIDAEVVSHGPSLSLEWRGKERRGTLWSLPPFEGSLTESSRARVFRPPECFFRFN